MILSSCQWDAFKYNTLKYLSKIKVVWDKSDCRIREAQYLGKLSFKLQFLYLETGDNASAKLSGLLWEVNEQISVICLAHSKESINAIIISTFVDGNALIRKVRIIFFLIESRYQKNHQVAFHVCGALVQFYMTPDTL